MYNSHSMHAPMWLVLRFQADRQTVRVGNDDSRFQENPLRLIGQPLLFPSFQYLRQFVSSPSFLLFPFFNLLHRLLYSDHRPSLFPGFNAVSATGLNSSELARLF